MKAAEHIRKGFGKLKGLAEQLYTPKELRALLLFAGLGLAVLLVRFGGNIYQQTTFPNARSAQAIKAAKNQDSLFHALTAIANDRDSLFFSLPEDSLVPRYRRSATHRKGEGLPLHSIVLNAANKQDLILLPGIGPAKAEQILEYRSIRGKFRTLDEVQNVQGIGPKRFAAMKKYLRLN